MGNLWFAILAFCLNGALESTPLSTAPKIGDWPQWRGPARDGRVLDQSPWPTSLKGLRRIWRHQMGPGYSGPIVCAGKLISTETLNESHERVRAFDINSGAELWQAEWPGAMEVPFFARSNGSWIRATPACDDSSVYIGGIRDVLVALDLRTGKERWRIDFPQKFEAALPAFGFVSSPLPDAGHLYVQAGGCVAKVNATDGAILWRSLCDDGGMHGSAFSSPIMTTLCGQRQLVVQTREKLAGVDPESGAVLWAQEVPAFRGMNILTPTVFKDGILTSTHKNRTFFYEIRKSGETWSAEQKWSHAAQGYMSSPVLDGHHAYLHLGNGRLSCLNLLDGKEAWRSKSFGKYWSMIINGDRILALDERGDLLLLQADPREFTLLDQQKVSEDEAWAHVALAGDKVFVRDLRGLSAFAWK